MSATTQTLMTADELLEMPHGDFRYELIAGELIKMSPTGGMHGIITMRLGGAVYNHVEGNNHGYVFGAETGFKLASNPDTVRAADVAFVSHARMPKDADINKFLPIAPDLVVEVISPSDTLYEVEEKIAAWLEAGALAVWVANPKRRTATAHRPHRPPQVLTEADALEEDEILRGFSYPLAKLFAIEQR